MSRSGRILFVSAAAIATLSVMALVVVGIVSRQLQTEDHAEAALRGGLVVDPNANQAPPVLGNLPTFILTEQSGKSFGSEQLLGKVWIADFIFTRCPGPCPRMSGEMSALQVALRKHREWKDIRMVSFTVDPEFDTPEVLRSYAEKYHADPLHWAFLTGPREQLLSLANDCFKLAAGEETNGAERWMVHSTKFVLVDRVGRVRGYYEGLDDAERGKLVRDLNRVIAEK